MFPGVLFTHDYDIGEDWVDSIRSLVAPQTETECEDVLLAGVSQLLDNSAYKKYPVIEL